MGRIIEKIPHVEEKVGGHAVTVRDIVLQVEKARSLTAKLNGVTPQNLRGHILVGISPLILDATNRGSELIWRDAADLANVVHGKSDRRLRIVGNFIPAPSGCVDASFIQK